MLTHDGRNTQTKKKQSLCLNVKIKRPHKLTYAILKTKF